ncbi:MAG: NYN domain-containing protein [Pirellulaceae bacterium]
MTEPKVKRTVAFIDGQNLFHAGREAFGHRTPNYDPAKLATAIASQQTGWQLVQIRFYTGIPDAGDNPKWHRFWSAKLLAMSRAGIVTYSRPLRYRNKQFRLPDGSTHAILVGEEKGIDVRLALDITRLAHKNAYDVALVFSQDQDLSEAADDVRITAKEQGRWIKIASAFPTSPTTKNRRGINSTDWIKIDRATYDTCLDPRQYRDSCLVSR